MPARAGRPDRRKLCTDKEYADFKLFVEWRWPEGAEPRNSGVLLRITGKPARLPKCVEAQLKDGNAGDLWAFQGFTIDGPPERIERKESVHSGKVTGIARTAGVENPPGQWNTMEITADGGTITLVLNGTQVNQTTDADATAGKIGLQSEGGPVEFRSVRLIPLDE